MASAQYLAEGARNLLINCAQLQADESLLIVCEDPALGWYDSDTSAAIALEAKNMGVSPEILQVNGPLNTRDPSLTDAIQAHDCTIFLARLGDQERFSEPVPGKKNIMCYARDAEMLASNYGRADHHAFVDLKTAVNKVLLTATRIHITCPLGTDLSGNIAASDKADPRDVTVQRFPLGVPQPLSASGLSGQVALARFLCPTGSMIYVPPFMPIRGTVMAQIRNGRIAEFSGDPEAVAQINAHHQMVAETFNIDGDIVHSFHAGIHPACAYTRDARLDPDHWSNSVFTNPRILHFHVCGNYAPGEICWLVVDPTISIDGKPLWEHGSLCLEAFEPTRDCLDRWPVLQSLFADPEMSIGL